MNDQHAIYRSRLPGVTEEHSPLDGEGTLMDSRQSYGLFAKHFDGAAQAEFIALYLNAKHAPLGYYVVLCGSRTRSIVHPRASCKRACVMNAAAVIFAHYHPSGAPTPSPEDRV